MIKFINRPATVKAAGNKPKTIEEYVGKINSETDRLSIARMKSPYGWSEPAQRPEFDEYSLVLSGTLRVETDDGVIDVNSNQAIIITAGEWVRYSTPFEEGAEYIAVCSPAFAPETVNRDE